jgi:phage protein D
MSRPTFVVDGQSRATLADGLLSMSIVEDVDGLYRCEATFGNWGSGSGTTLDYLYFDRSVLEFGKTFVVKLGNDTLFEGAITGLEGQFPAGRSPEVTVLAEDRLQDLRMTRRTRTFTDLDDAGVIRQIAGDHGLTADVSLNGPTHKVLAQVNQSDLAFVRERAQALDAEVWVNGRTLHVKSHADRRQTAVPLSYRVELTAFSVLADLAHQRTAVTVTGWDVSGKSAITQEATDSTVSGELDGGKSGSSVLKNAFGDRKETIAHDVPMTTDAARNAAEAAFKLRARRFITAHGVATTSASIKVGGSADVKGVGPLFNGKYYLTHVRHLFDGNGLRSEFTGERPGLGTR